MKVWQKWISLLFCVFLVILPLVAQDGEAETGENLFRAEPHAAYVAGEVLVKYKANADLSAMGAHLQSLGIQSVKSYSTIRVDRCSLGDDMSVEDALNQLAEHPSIEYCEPNYLYSIYDGAVPNDPSYGSQWALNNTGQTGGTADADIDAPEAWNMTTGSGSIVVGVIDTGVDDTHPDLVDNMWRNPGESGGGKESNGVDDDGNGFVDDYRGWDFANNDNNPFDDNAHGTHCAGILGAVGNNSRGISGANWSVKIVGLKFLTGSGSGSTAGAIDAILYGAQMGFPILSNSWGGGGRSQALADAIETASQAGVLFVAAAGNSSSNNDRADNFPSNYTSENVLAVAASDHRDQLSSFSSFGLTTVDLAAPGTNILSTTPSNNYQSFSGTSMATPYVSGVAALAMAQFPGISMTNLKYRLMGSTDAKPAFTNVTVTGGRLNAQKALGTSPMIVVEPRGNTTDTNTAYTVNAFATDDGPINSVTLEYTLSGTNTGGDVVAMTGNGKYTATIPAQPLNTTITYFAKATDASGATVQSLTRSFKISLTDDGGGGGGGGIPCGCGAFALSIDTGNTTLDATATLFFNILLVGLVLLFFVRRRR